MKRAAPKRRTPIRRVAKREISDRLLDDLCREIVFRRDGYKCVKTGEPCRAVEQKGTRRIYHGLQWAHVFSRNKKSMRWDPDNSMCLSPGAHLWWHHHPTAAAAWFAATFPERDARLKLLASTPQKLDRALILVALQQKLGTE